MFRVAAAITTAVLIATVANPVRADDVTPVLNNGGGVWWVEVGGFMKTRYEYTFRKDGSFQVETYSDVAVPKGKGTWKITEKDGKMVLALTSTDRGLLPAESEARYDKTKNALVVRMKDGTETVLTFRKAR